MVDTIWPDLDNPLEVIEALKHLSDQRVDQSKRSIFGVAANLLEEYRVVIKHHYEMSLIETAIPTEEKANG